MKGLKLIVAGLLLSLVSLTVRADVVVLVHGYLGTSQSWEQSGVSTVLEQNGWQRAGVVRLGPAGAEVLSTPLPKGEQLSYMVELPSLAPMMVQADQLNFMLQKLMVRHSGEPLHIIAHSAGGVVARLALVRHRLAPQVQTLITIAAPHLGTLRAVQALDATDNTGPFGFVKDMFGGDLYHTVKHSKGALVDLTPATPGNLLYWLNAQAHPDIAYHSIIRTGPVGMGDELVPTFSQDMNNVHALRGQSQHHVSFSGHQMMPQDGELLARILNGVL